MENNDIQAVQNTEVESDTTQVSSPEIEVAPTQQTDEGNASPKVETVDSPNEEQRRAFQEMRLENKKLKEELEARRKNESAFDAFKPKPANVSPETLVDPLTGETNWDAVRQQSIAQARAEAANAARIELDEFQARQKHPDLFADPETEQELADRWFAATMRGENVTITQIADRYASRYKKDLTKAEKSGAEKALQEVAQKEQAALTAPSQSPSVAQREASSKEVEQLRTQARFGNDDALANLMSRVPWANK